MSSVDDVKAYLDWARERKDMTVDTSPEAWAVDVALERLVDVLENLDFMNGGQGWEAAYIDYMKAKRDLETI